MKKIGFIGLGVMGKAMVKNLLKHGFEVDFYARHKEKTLDAIEAGAVFHDTIKDAVKDADVVITMVGGPKDVEEIYLNSDGILDSVKKGTYLIDMTSSSPSLAVRLNEEGQKRGLHVLDVPVTGGDVGARDGTLSLMVGGSQDDMDKVLNVLKAMGTTITYMGKSGAGQCAKLVNQIMVAGAFAGMCEGLAFAKVTGLDLKTILKAVSGGLAGSRVLEILSPRIVEGDFKSGGALKYLRIIISMIKI